MYTKNRRLRDFDYSSLGAYFVTICAYQRRSLFANQEIRETTERCWREIPEHFFGIELDAFVIMPNHIHGIVKIVDKPATVGALNSMRLRSSPGTQTGSLGAIMQSFKGAVTRDLRHTGVIGPGQPLWQASY